jgi:hypothetical protein
MFVIVTALLAGFVGGILGTHVSRAREQPGVEQVVRARSFELVNQAGQTISYWGVDQGHNAVLAFGRPGALPGHPGLGLGDPDKERVAIGLIDDWAFLKFRGADGRTRVRLLLTDYGKPALLMEDESGPRVSLGIEQSDTPGPGDNDWTLAFYPERARIGMFTETESGQTYVRGIFLLNKDKVKHPYRQPR